MFDAFDNFVVEKLEKFFLKIPVSPYSIARFSLSGYIFILIIYIVVLFWGNDFLSAFTNFILLLFSIYAYLEFPRKAERAAACGKISPYRKYSFTRNCYLVANFCYFVPGLFKISYVAIVSLSINSLVAFFAYLIAISWVPPKKKTKTVSNVVYQS